MASILYILSVSCGERPGPQSNSGKKIHCTCLGLGPGSRVPVYRRLAFPGDPVVKNLPANAGDTGDVGSIPGSGRSPGVGNDNPLQYSCLENPMDRGAWWATVHGGLKESDTTE